MAVTAKTCLWFDGNAEEATAFYTSVLADSRIDSVVRSPMDTPSGPEGSVLFIEFTIGTQQLQALNGGPQFTFDEAVSLVVECDSQEESDRYWDALTGNGGSEGPCGWLKDRFGMSWQVYPREMNAILGDPDPDRARRAGEAMLRMHRIDVAALRAAADAA